MVKYQKTYLVDRHHAAIVFQNTDTFKLFATIVKLPEQRVGAGKELFNTPYFSSIDEIKEYSLSEINAKNLK